jgi:hypothetical protein
MGKSTHRKVIRIHPRDMCRDNCGICAKSYPAHLLFGGLCVHCADDSKNGQCGLCGSPPGEGPYDCPECGGL